jgi:hypothetical protein
MWRFGDGRVVHALSLRGVAISQTDSKLTRYINIVDECMYTNTILDAFLEKRLNKVASGIF